MSIDANYIVTNFAPWIAALGAITIGVVSNMRASRADSKQDFQQTLSQMHDLYHNLVTDLSEQVDRLEKGNEKLSTINAELTASVESLTEENKGLKRTVKALTSRIRALEDK